MFNHNFKLIIRISCFAFVLSLFACAQQGNKSLTGGLKDETPPVVEKSNPENYSTNFTASEVEIKFDEYVQLKNLKEKLVISPVMEEKPEIEVKGKNLLIKFKSDLLPDRTYTLNFGDALVDLNESNPFENFMYVFSTGDKLDSLQIAGIVSSAIDNKPVEGAAVMLYPEDTDSLPLTTLPTYLSISDETGQFNLKNLASGSYKIFALVDVNNNFLFDQAKESIAFLDTLITPYVEVITIDTIPPQDTTNQGQTTKDQRLTTNDSLLQTQDPGLRTPDSLLQTKDQGLTTQDSLLRTPDLFYGPKNIELKTFTEILPKQNITSTARPFANKIEVLFNEALDSLKLDLLYYDRGSQADTDTTKLNDPALMPGPAFLCEWSSNKDSISIWITDTTLAQRDSLIFVFGYNKYDSLEAKMPVTDTIRFNFRKSADKEDKNPFQITSNIGRTKELNSAARIQTSFPTRLIDTSYIEVLRKQDTLDFTEAFELLRDTITDFHVNSIEEIYGLSLLHLRKMSVKKVFLPDSSYSITLYPGALTSYGGLTNDTTKFSFKVNTEDKYGTIKINIENLEETAILELIDSKDNVVGKRLLSTSGSEIFSLLKPGKYTFKLILDSNDNGIWDPGRYLKHIQAEELILYGKEIDLKANWEMDESWDLNE